MNALILRLFFSSVLLISGTAQSSQDLDLTIYFTDGSSLSGPAELDGQSNKHFSGNYENEIIKVPFVDISKVEIESYRKGKGITRKFGPTKEWWIDYTFKLSTKAGMDVIVKGDRFPCYANILRVNKLTKKTEKKRFLFTGANSACKYSSDSSQKKIVAIEFN